MPHSPTGFVCSCGKRIPLDQYDQHIRTEMAKEVKKGFEDLFGSPPKEAPQEIGLGKKVYDTGVNPDEGD